MFPRSTVSQESQWCNHPFKWIKNGWSNAHFWLLFWLSSVKFSLGESSEYLLTPHWVSQCLSFLVLKRTATCFLLLISSHNSKLNVEHVSHIFLDLPLILKSQHLFPMTHPDNATCYFMWLEKERCHLAILILPDKGQLFWVSLLMK